MMLTASSSMLMLGRLRGELVLHLAFGIVHKSAVFVSTDDICAELFESFFLLMIYFFGIASSTYKLQIVRVYLYSVNV